MQKRVPRTREYIDHRLRFFNGTGDLLDMFEIGFFNIGYIGARCACQPKNCQYIPTQMILLFKLPPWYPVNSCKKSVQRTREYINHRLRFFNGTEDLLDMFEIGPFNIVYIGAREKVPTVETRPQKLRTPECNASESESQEGQGQKQPYNAEFLKMMCKFAKYSSIAHRLIARSPNSTPFGGNRFFFTI